MRRCKPLPCLAACLLVDGDSWLIIISLYYVEGVIKLNLTFSHLCTMLYLSSIKTWVTAERLNTHKYSIIQHFIYHKCFNNYLCALGWVKRAEYVQPLHSTLFRYETSSFIQMLCYSSICSCFYLYVLASTHDTSSGSITLYDQAELEIINHYIQSSGSI